MAFPWIFESNFETGDNSEWDSETDTGSQLDIAHYSELARFPWPTAVPFEGAYCMRVALSSTVDAFLLEGSIDISLSGNRFVAFDMWLSPDFTGTANDTINILELQSTGPAVEVAFGLRVVAATNVVNLGIGETAPTSFSSLALDRSVWYTIELDVTLDSGGTDGTIDLYVSKTGEPYATSVAATQVGSLAQAAVIQGVLGVQDQLATTTGTILFDNFKFDDARIYPKKRRYDDTVLLTKSGHAFVGRGTVDNVTLMSGAGTDCVLAVYDSDTGDTNDATSMVLELKNTAVNEVVDPAGTPVNVVQGAFVQLSGTNPRALVKMCNVQNYSDANVRSHGLRRKV